jgi:HK97 family phage major capsid protein
MNKTISSVRGIQMVRADATDPKAVLAELQKAWHEFKAENDIRLKDIEAKGGTDPLLEAKVDKINAEITKLTTLQSQVEALETHMARSQFPGGGQIDKKQAEYKEAFNAYFRKGDVQAALSTGSDPDGGFAVPVELDKTILDLLRNAAPIRQLANVITVSTPNYQKLVNKHGLVTGWVGETDARPETGTNALALMTPFMGELYANPAATQAMLEDAFFNVEAWLATEVQAEFASAENTSFTTGNGVAKPKGILGYTTALTVDASRAFGTVQHIATGEAAIFKVPTATISPADCLIDTIYALKAGYRQGSSWMINSLTTAAMRKFKDTVGNYIWSPPSVGGVINGQAGTLLGYGIVNNEDMPDIGANALVAAFGDFRRGYTIVDRIGSTVLRDPFTNKPYVHFYTRKRVGGMVTDSNAFKLVKVCA